MLRERRRAEPGAHNDTLIVCGVLLIVLVTTVGDYVLVFHGKEPPPWAGQLPMMAIGGLFGVVGTRVVEARRQAQNPVPPEESETS